MKKNNIIVCPNCGAEYLPGEIFIPDAFIGHPDTVIRNTTGKILGYDGPSMDLEETFTCEHCNKEFKVTASVNFKTDKIGEIFDEEFYIPEKK